MSTEAPAAPQKINLRRPDVMAAVQAQVLSHYRSDLVERIRASGHVLSAGDLTIKLAKEFGFCYGVERAIDLAYAARKVFPNQPIYILGEIIHNPEVNDQIRAMGIKFLSGKEKDADIADLKKDDIVIIPAFGTEVSTRAQLEAKGCRFVDTTCGDVMSVWKRVRQYSKDKVTSIIHGKAWHEETKATSSQAMANGGGHYLVVFTLAETDYVCRLHPAGRRQGGVPGEVQRRLFRRLRSRRPSAGHRRRQPDHHAARRDRGSAAPPAPRHGAEDTARSEIDRHFRFFDTICGATQDRQDALEKLLQQPLDLLLVIGGYNSSNTSHLAEMGEAKLPTYFIKNAAKMRSDKLILHYDQHKHEEVETQNWLPPGKVTVGITAGASCPNNLIEDAIRTAVRAAGHFGAAASWGVRLGGPVLPPRDTNEHG